MTSGRFAHIPCVETYMPQAARKEIRFGGFHAQGCAAILRLEGTVGIVVKSVRGAQTFRIGHTARRSRPRAAPALGLVHNPGGPSRFFFQNKGY
jgi:hypothetical protein